MHQGWRPSYRTDRPCQACQHFGGLTNGAAICHHGGGVIVQARPQFGCAFWERKVEGDPRPEPPPEVSLAP